MRGELSNTRRQNVRLSLNRFFLPYFKPASQSRTRLYDQRDVFFFISCLGNTDRKGTELNRKTFHGFREPGSYSMTTLRDQLFTELIFSFFFL